MDYYINNIQIKKFKKIFLRSGKTFQKMAEEADLKNIPDHLNELTYDQARKFLKHHWIYLIESK